MPIPLAPGGLASGNDGDTSVWLRILRVTQLPNRGRRLPRNRRVFDREIDSEVDSEPDVDWIASRVGFQRFDGSAHDREAVFPQKVDRPRECLGVLAGVGVVCRIKRSQSNDRVDRGTWRAAVE